MISHVLQSKIYQKTLAPEKFHQEQFPDWVSNIESKYLQQYQNYYLQMVILQHCLSVNLLIYLQILHFHKQEHVIPEKDLYRRFFQHFHHYNINTNK